VWNSVLIKQGARIGFSSTNCLFPKLLKVIRKGTGTLLPTEIYRAKLEEKALAQKFGAEWENYSKKTGFILPIPKKH
jgi:protein-S-isoprenylcysteine O-methyltransferase Ste14